MIDKIAKLAGRVTRENIETIQKYTKLASQEGKKTIGVDIGTLGGQSAIAMALAVDDIKVYTMDPIASPAISEQIKKMGAEKKIQFYPMTSSEFTPLCPNQIDICFVDGVHSYLGVKADIENIGLKVRLGGYLLFHDCNLYFNTIKKAVEENVDKYYEFIEEVGGTFTEKDKQGSIWVGRRI